MLTSGLLPGVGDTKRSCAGLPVALHSWLSLLQPVTAAEDSYEGEGSSVGIRMVDHGSKMPGEVSYVNERLEVCVPHLPVPTPAPPSHSDI